MNLLFDLVATQPVNEVKRHGGGIYGEIVLKRIVERKLDVLCFYDSKKWLNPDINRLLREKNIKLFDINHITINQIIKNENIDSLYSPFPRSIEENINVPFYGTIHGLRVFETPWDWNVLKYRNVSIAEKVKLFIKKVWPKLGFRNSYIYFNTIFNDNRFYPIAVSNHTAHSIKVYFPYTAEKEIPVFYSPSTTNNDIINGLPQKDYYLLVSANRWEKNCLRAIQALDRLFDNYDLSSKTVIVTGVKTPSIFKYSLRHPNRFVFKGYVDDDELKSIYFNAYCLIYPTLNEGFGYPPIEAMRYGIPVISSPFSSLPEVCGKGAIYFNPFSVEELMNRILCLEEPAVYEEWSKKANEQYIKIHNRQISDLDSLIDYLYKEKKA